MTLGEIVTEMTRATAPQPGLPVVAFDQVAAWAEALSLCVPDAIADDQSPHYIDDPRDRILWAAGWNACRREMLK